MASQFQELWFDPKLGLQSKDFLRVIWFPLSSQKCSIVYAKLHLDANMDCRVYCVSDMIFQIHQLKTRTSCTFYFFSQVRSRDKQVDICGPNVSGTPGSWGSSMRRGSVRGGGLRRAKSVENSGTISTRHQHLAPCSIHEHCPKRLRYLLALYKFCVTCMYFIKSALFFASLGQGHLSSNLEATQCIKPCKN